LFLKIEKLKTNKLYGKMNKKRRIFGTKNKLI